MAFVAALNKDRPVDHLIRGIFPGDAGNAVILSRLMLMLIFSIKLEIFPISGKGQNLLENLRFLFLPALTISVAMSPMLIRSLRSSLIDICCRRDVDFARAKGSGLSDRDDSSRPAQLTHFDRTVLGSTWGGSSEVP